MELCRAPIVLAMAEELDLDPGVAGASSRREYERRRAEREDRTRRRHPHIGNLLLWFQKAPKEETAWATGATGEEILATSLARRCSGVIVLNDRRMPRSRANIDHLAIAPSGIYVIDAKRYKGKIEVRRPLFGKEKLFIWGRDKTQLVEGLERQVAAVRTAIGPVAPHVPVRGCFCFINPDGQSGGTKLPLFRTLSINGYPLLFPRKLVKRLRRQGDLSPEEMRRVAQVLAQQFPAA